FLASCSNTKQIHYGFKEFKVIYNAHNNTVIGNTMFVRNIGDVSMFLHEYAHILHYKHKKPSNEMVILLESEYPIPPAIAPTEENRELQDFITTSTRWKVKYPFKHKENTLIVEELMANLFVIFTMKGSDLEYVRTNYLEIYTEYEKYYNDLK
ncbi:MAG: hypothetical protein ACRCZL_04440, partial [Cetobacterium sp.]